MIFVPWTPAVEIERQKWCTDDVIIARPNILQSPWCARFPSAITTIVTITLKGPQILYNHDEIPGTWDKESSPLPTPPPPGIYFTRPTRASLSFRNRSRSIIRRSTGRFVLQLGLWITRTDRSLRGQVLRPIWTQHTRNG